MSENERTWVVITAEAHAALKSRAIYPWSEEGKRQPDGTWKVPLSTLYTSFRIIVGRARVSAMQSFASVTLM